MWTEPEIEIDLVFIRHGATLSNVEHRYLGKTEEPLSETGKAMLLDWKAGGRYEEGDYLFSSPMLRCRQTAALLFKEKKPHIISKWREMDFGKWEGKNWKDLEGDKEYQNWIDSEGTLPFPQGEGIEDFKKRAKEGFEEMLSVLALEKGTRKSVCVVVHGGIIMALCSELSGGNYFDYQVDNGGGYGCKLLYKGNKRILVKMEKLSWDII